MKMVRVLFAGAVAILWAGAASADVVSAKAKGSYGEVKDSVVLAIQAKGFKIDYTAHIGNMLERTGKDVGSTKRVFGNAEALQFCSAVVSRKMMEDKASNIAYCPYVIALYTLPDDPKTVYVVYRRGLPDVDALLAGIVKEALQ
ncbi:MAG: hypothetical protein AMJ64_08000 [Betaproteobacteria bacterium SG8_39]|nr:MAG: hypothetical protein AMJ64_08000 [Betaproteobacteria bacterium SG8_39]